MSDQLPASSDVGVQEDRAHIGCGICDQPVPDHGDLVCIDCYNARFARTPARPVSASLVADQKEKPASEEPSCSRCRRPHPFDTSIPSVVWNTVIRAQGLPDYLCLTCIVEAFACFGGSFTATLWGGPFQSGLPIEVRIGTPPAPSGAGSSLAPLEALRQYVQRLQRKVHEQAVASHPMFSTEHWRHNAGNDWPDVDDASYEAFENCQHEDCVNARVRLPALQTAWTALEQELAATHEKYVAKQAAAYDYEKTAIFNYQRAKDLEVENARLKAEVTFLRTRGEHADACIAGRNERLSQLAVNNDSLSAELTTLRADNERLKAENEDAKSLQMPGEVLVGLVGDDGDRQRLLAAWDVENERRHAAEAELTTLRTKLAEQAEQVSMGHEWQAHLVRVLEKAMIVPKGTAVTLTWAVAMLSERLDELQTLRGQLTEQSHAQEQLRERAALCFVKIDGLLHRLLVQSIKGQPVQGLASDLQEVRALLTPKEPS